MAVTDSNTLLHYGLIHSDRSLTPATGQKDTAFYRHVIWIPRFLLGVLQPGVECTDACYETNRSDDQETAFIWNHS
jgi:hypothetical protein